MFHNVCRLCLGTEELIWIFNEKMAPNMPEIIEVTSGVQITKSDTVTQMVCNTCCQITIKMYKFRTTSIKNDKDLKARCAGYNISQLRNSIVQTKQETANSSAAAVAASPTAILSENTTLRVTVTSNTISPPARPPPTPPATKFQIPQKYKFAHPSIKEIIKQNPNIQLPEVSPNSHFGAYITLLTDEVDDWYKEKNFTDSQIEEIKKAAVSYANELEIPVPEPQRKRRRKYSIESASSSTSRKSSSDKSVTENGGSKKKRIKLNGDILLQSNADTATDKVKGSSVSKPKVTAVPKMIISMTKTNIDTLSASSASTTVNLDSDSNSKIKINANFNDIVKTDSNIPKSGANVSAKSSASVKSNITQSTDNNSSAKANVGSTATNVSKSEPSPKETLHLGTVLHSLLTKEDPPKGRQEEITLSSILRSMESTKSVLEPASDSDDNDAGDDPSYEPEPGDLGSDTEVIEIEEPGKKIERPIRTKNDQPHNRSKPKDEYTLFTTRPFVRNATNVRQSKLDLRTQNCENAELFVLSDSDDDEANKKPDRATVNADPIIVDNDSSEATNLQSSKDNSDQNKASNAPDLSLVTVTHKSNTLFTCKVCDGHYHNIKDLKIHERKNHTKCPFCNKKFRSLASRDEHVKYTCTINNAPFDLKNPKLELTRVDEIEEIRKQYASAFEEMEYISEETKSNGSDAGVPSTTATDSEALPKQSPRLPPQHPVDQAVSELEQFLQSTRSSSEQNSNIVLTEGSGNNNETIAAESVAENSASNNNGDIICISDDEADTLSTKEPLGKPKIKIINNDKLKNINLQDNDLNVLKNILAEARLNKTKRTVSIDALKNNSIVDGGTSRVKIFRDLRKHLQHYKIPIEIQYSPNLNVEYKYAASAPRRKLTDLWYGMIPQDLKGSNKPLSKLPPSSSTAVATIPTSKVKTASLILHPQQSGGVVSKIVTSTNNIFNTVCSQSPIFAMTQVAPIVSSTLGGTLSSSSNLILTSQPPSMNDHSYSNRPVVLNNAQSVCANNTTNNVTNYIFVSGTLLQTGGKMTEASLPAAQGPLPIIQYVTSAQEQQQPLTITEESTSGPEISSTTTTTTSTATVAAVQPAIRVKNLSELS